MRNGRAIGRPEEAPAAPKSLRPQSVRFAGDEQSLGTDAALQHEPGAGAQLLRLALQLAARGQDVATTRGADGRGIAGAEHDLREILDLLPVRAFVARAGPGIERD